MFNVFSILKSKPNNYSEIRTEIRNKINEHSINSLDTMLAHKRITDYEYSKVKTLILQSRKAIIIPKVGNESDENSLFSCLFKAKIYSDTQFHREGTLVRLFATRNPNEYHVTKTACSVKSILDAIDIALNSEVIVKLNLPNDKEKVPFLIDRLFNG